MQHLWNKASGVATYVLERLPQSLLQQLIHCSGVGFAAAGFHRLNYK